MLENGRTGSTTSPFRGGQLSLTSWNKALKPSGVPDDDCFMHAFVTGVRCGGKRKGGTDPEVDSEQPSGRPRFDPSMRRLSTSNRIRVMRPAGASHYPRSRIGAGRAG